MITQTHADLIAIADAVQFTSASSYQILNRSHQVDGASQEPPGDTPRVVSALTAGLYEQLYTRPLPSNGLRAPGWSNDHNFLAALSAANTGRGTWDPDWVVRHVHPDGPVVVGRSELDVWVSPRDLRTATGRINPGDRCQIRVPKEMRHLMKGFFFVFGDTAQNSTEEISDGTAGPLWRYYWHLTSQAAAPFIAAATSILNTCAVPFRLKVLKQPTAYQRADAGVLYIDRGHALKMGDAIREIHQTVSALLRPETPLLTCRLGDGLALAEAPPSSSSYGQHRCRLIARALWHSFLSGRHDRDDRLEALLEAFQQERLDPRYPYLAPGSSIEKIHQAAAVFSAPAEGRDGGDGRRSVGTAGATRVSALSPLEAALRIGRQLCETACWDSSGRLCNWVGQSPLEASGSGAILPAAAALGPELYGGSAGIAVFLAQLQALSGDATIRRTAVGAAARSLRQVLDRPGSLPVPLSLFAGRLGVAYAAHRVATLTGQGELHVQAGSLLESLETELDRPHVVDVIGGNAGAIPALLSLIRDDLPAGQSHRYRARAIALGEELCHRAVWSGQICTWSADPRGRQDRSPPLTGMSHGASGIAVALLELHRETGYSRFLQAARGALAYEDSVFDAQAGNWPDLRPTGDPERVSTAPIYWRTWCHGAPGIALARSRAAALDPENAETHRAMARAAIHTTLLAIDESLPRPGHDASLCHGLTGLLEAVLVAGQQLGDGECLDRAAAVARVLTDRHADFCDYPSGLLSHSVNPSLMLGLAGTGYAFLRLHAPCEVPSLLLVGFRGC